MSIPSPPRYNICFVSDFFYPRLGGVELHQYQLAQGLIQRGHKVIIITGTYTTDNNSNLTNKSNNNNTDNTSNNISIRQGIRYLSNGLKVYYLPQISIHSQATLPTLYNLLPLFRRICIRESITIVHGHQSTSSLVHELIMHSKLLGLITIYTDHSLFGLSNPASIHLNQLLKFTLNNIDSIICVSQCNKENLYLRSLNTINPDNIFVIPNAIDTSKFKPANPAVDAIIAPKLSKQINIVVLSRLVYRKGIDLLIDIIPIICSRYSNIHFLIGGSGPKQLLLEEMIERYELQDRVELLGSIEHSSVRSVLIQGHIFLNCSLTESFCIAILEAVSCGLYIVSTRVGGVPEILPPNQFIQFTAVNSIDIINGLSNTIESIQITGLTPEFNHSTVKSMYNWHSIAARTERVYNYSIEKRKLHQKQLMSNTSDDNTDNSTIEFDRDSQFLYQLYSFNHSGGRIAEWITPNSTIEKAVEFPIEYYKQRYKSKPTNNTNTNNTNTDTIIDDSDYI